MGNNKGILIGLVAVFLGFFSVAIEYYFKVGFIARLGVLISFILGSIGFIVHIQEMKKPKKGNTDN